LAHSQDFSCDLSRALSPKQIYSSSRCYELIRLRLVNSVACVAPHNVEDASSLAMRRDVGAAGS